MWTVEPIHDRPARLFIPEQPARAAVLFLHDLDQRSLVADAVYTRWLEQEKLICLAPDGGTAWWTDRPMPGFGPEPSAEQYVLRAVLPWLRQRAGLGGRPVGLFGVGMGGQGALRLGFKHAGQFPVVAGITSALDCHELHGQGTDLDAMYDSKEQCRQDTALLHLRSDRCPPHVLFCCHPQDDWFRGNDRLHEKMNALGVPHQVDLTTPAGGHSGEYHHHQAERVLGFLGAALRQEARRLL